MMQYSIEIRTRKYVIKYGFLSFARNFSNKYRKRLLDTGLDAVKTTNGEPRHVLILFVWYGRQKKSTQTIFLQHF